MAYYEIPISFIVLVSVVFISGISCLKCKTHPVSVNDMYTRTCGYDECSKTDVTPKWVCQKMIFENGNVQRGCVDNAVTAGQGQSISCRKHDDLSADDKKRFGYSKCFECSEEDECNAAQTTSPVAVVHHFRGRIPFLEVHTPRFGECTVGQHYHQHQRQ